MGVQNFTRSSYKRMAMMRDDESIPKDSLDGTEK